MNRMTKIIFFSMAALLVLSGCFADTSSTGIILPQASSAAIEVGKLSTVQGNGTLEETRMETTMEETEKEPIVLKVCSLNAGNIGFQNGWADKIVMDKFNIKIYYVDYLSYGWDIDKICEEEPDIDIIVWPRLYFYEEHLGSRLSLEWDDALLEYAPYLTEYLGEQIDYVTERSGGKPYGFIADSTNSERTELESVWTIGKGSTHPEAAMTLLNWLASSEGVLTCWYGPRGVCWDIDGEGYYYLTELGVKFEKEVVGILPEEYGGYTNGLNFGNLAMGLVYRRSVVSPDSIHGETYDWTTWHLMQDQIE